MNHPSNSMGEKAAGNVNLAKSQKLFGNFAEHGTSGEFPQKNNEPFVTFLDFPVLLCYNGADLLCGRQFMNTTAGKRRASRRSRYVCTVFGTLLLMTGFLFLFAARWYRTTYGNTGFDSILFTLFSDLGGVESDLILSFFTSALLPALALAAVTAGVLFYGTGAKKRGFYPLSNAAAAVLSVLLTILLSCTAGYITGLHLYIYDMFHESAIFEEKYVSPDSVTITFPEKKRNLIYILLESMETTYFSEEQGGAEDVCLIPELYTLAQENVNFSQNDSVGGFRSASGTTWTIGAMVGQTAGVPLKTPSNVEDWQNGYGKDGVFLPGLKNLGDILHENGYYQALMVGSVASFGGRKTYYETHGTDRIYELSTARRDGIVPRDYFVWWGIEDLHLVDYAKQELLKMADGDQPFAFTMLTVDTHHIGGYVCSQCGNTHDEQYENVISCSSRRIAEFVEWIRQQDFYENTTVIICGDHPSMDKGYFTRNVPESYVRRVYNCYLNAAAVPVNEKNRDFNTLDLFPTTLAAMGCTIEGERLGLGTNLFSDKPTLAETMGFDRLDRQISQKSTYYAQVFRQEKQEENVSTATN